jgi:hypothetical protein
LKSYTFSILVISPLEPCISGKFSFTFGPLKILQFANRSLTPSTFLPPLAGPLFPLFLHRRLHSSKSGRGSAAPCPPSLPGAALSYPQPYLPVLSPIPVPPRTLRRRRLCHDPRRRGARLCAPPFPSPLYKKLPRDLWKLFPHSLAPLPRRSSAPRATIPPPLLSHAGDHLPSLPKSGQGLKRVRPDALFLPTPFPLLINHPIAGIGDGTELAPAGHGRRTYSRRFNSFQGSK